MIKFVKSQKTGEYVEIGPSDMDYNTRFALTKEELTDERDAIIRAIGNPGVKVAADAQASFDALMNKAKIDQGLASMTIMNAHLPLKRNA